MGKRARIGAGAVLFLSVAAAAIGAGVTAPAGATASRAATSPAAEYSPVCPPSSAAGVAHCGAIRLIDPAANWHGSHVPGALPDKNSGKGKGPGKGPGGPGGGGTTTPTTPAGYYPADIQSAYGLSSAISNFTSGSQTVAIVDAYNDPSATADLATYRSQFGLPPCTATTGCFTKVNQTGGTTYPTSSTSWSEEISLDLDMVSATCPGCKILLVEASSNSLANLGAAEDYAAAHAAAVSNSYGAAEFSGETTFDPYYDHPHVAITASAGDGGYGVEYPAASPYVTAVGGTTLTKNTSSPRGWSETVWSGTGSGCSAYEANPGWQPTTSQCATRTVADTAADANPNTGVAVYDSYGESGWLVFGGTSVASPIAASVYALAGNASTFTTDATGSDAAQGLYAASLNHVTSGTNSHHCKDYLCNAADSLATGFNGPTGNGTPTGTAGF